MSQLDAISQHVAYIRRELDIMRAAQGDANREILGELRRINGSVRRHDEWIAHHDGAEEASARAAADEAAEDAAEAERVEWWRNWRAQLAVGVLLAVLGAVLGHYL